MAAKAIIVLTLVPLGVPFVPLRLLPNGRKANGPPGVPVEHAA